MIKKKIPLLFSIFLLANTVVIPTDAPEPISTASESKDEMIDFSSLSPEQIEEALKKLTPEQLKELEEAQNLYMAQVNEVYEPFLGKIQDYLNRVYGVMSGISAAVMGGKVPTVANKKDIHTKIKGMNMMISELSSQKFMVADPRIIINLIVLTKAFTKHMIEALDNNLKNIKEFDIRAVLSTVRITEKDIEPAALQRELMVIDRMIRTLERKSESVGLLWYNNAYRFVADSRIVQTAGKYGLHKWIPLAYSAFVIGAWVFGSSTKQVAVEGNLIPVHDKNCFWEKTSLIPSFIKKNIFGQHPIRINGNTAINSEFIGPVGRLEEGVYSLYSSGHLVVTGAIMAYAFNAVREKWNRDVSPAINKALSIVHHTLRGGDSLQKAAQLGGKPDEVYFSDLVGLDHVKKTFATIVQYLENPESYARRGLTPEKGILLIGGTRTGKSYSVKALYNEIAKSQKAKFGTARFGFFEINASDIQATGGFKNLMDIARYNGPCVLFIDEIDLLYLQRGGQNPLLGEFLTSLSGALSNDDPKKQVIIIAATNNPETLDKALRASGRLGAELRYELPSLQDRIVFITKQLEKLSLDLEQFDIATLAQQTESHSFETLKGMINNATLYAAINGRVVTQQDIMMVIDQELRKIVSIDNKVIAPQEKLIVSSHFAGQALYLNLIDSRVKLAQVTTRQVMKTIGEKLSGSHLWNNDTVKDDEKRFEYGSVFTYNTGDTGHVVAYEEKKQECMLHLSGFIAEEILLGASAYSCNKDAMTYALHLAKALTFEGVDADKLPEDIRTEYHRKALRFIESCKQELRTMFKEQLPLLTVLRNELLDKEVLYQADVETIIKHYQEQSVTDGVITPVLGS